KRNKRTKGFHEFVISFTYSLISMLLAHPSHPTAFSEIMRNEGKETRKALERIGVPTPELISITETELREEFVEGGNLYDAIASGTSLELARVAGLTTARMHKADYVFIDNKAQNYLIKGDALTRTDLGFTRRTGSLYARSMDIATFLASVMDLDNYAEVERIFYDGYRSEVGRKLPYLSIIVRNLLSIGFSSSSRTTLRNMIHDTRGVVDI
ncbi:MAG: hypothetical protein ACRD98_03755, partial [Nitrososphaera sp.]